MVKQNSHVAKIQSGRSASNNALSRRSSISSDNLAGLDDIANSFRFDDQVSQMIEELRPRNDASSIQNSVTSKKGKWRRAFCCRGNPDDVVQSR
ncbi:MAG: hypothetical protein MK137_01215 [Rickettsiales bacterium]|nr:hypothetical protein [Rickettsiales bacterium]